MQTNRQQIEQELTQVNDRFDAICDDTSAASIAEQERLIERERILRDALTTGRIIRNWSGQLAAENID